MKIENLKSEMAGGKAKVSATVVWEDCDRPSTEVYFATDPEFSDGLTCNPHAFLVGCLIPAVHHGERRIFIDEQVCPELRSGLATAMNLIRTWYYEPERRLPKIETSARLSSPAPVKQERAGFFFSGGLDSFATLRFNRLNFPPEHPGSIKDGLIVFGLHREEPEAFKRVLGCALEIAPKAGIHPIPVYTNVLSLGYGWNFWAGEFQGAALASVAHAFARRLSVVSIAASDSIPGLELLKKRHFKPLGSHPLLDPQYGSSDLRIRHDGIIMTRLDKTRLIAGWDLALDNLRVCNNTTSISPGMLNCGECEKCVRTMLALMALGVLGSAGGFLGKTVTKELIARVGLPPPAGAGKDDYGVLQDYIELLQPLASAGRHDLVRAIRQKRTHLRLTQSMKRWKDEIRKIDHKYLNGAIVWIKRFISAESRLAWK